MLTRIRQTSADYPRQYWLLFWGMGVNSTGSSLIWPFLTIYMRQQLGITLTTVTLLTAIDSASRLLVTALAGPAMDRLGRKSGMILGLIGSATTMISMSVAATLPLWVVLSAAFGGFNALFRIGTTSMVADIIEPQQRIDAYALLRTIVNLGVAIGPAIGGFITSVSYSIAFYLAAGAHVSFATLIFSSVEETLPQATPGMSKRDSSYGPVLRDRPFVTLIGIIILGGMPATMMFVLLPVYLKENFGILESQYGFLLASNAIMVVTLQYAITRFARRFRPLLVLAAGSLFYAFGAGSVAWGRAFPMFLVSIVILTLGEMLLFPTSTALTANLAPPDMRARYMGAYNLTWGIAQGIGPLTGALLNDNLAPAAIWYGAFVLGLAGSFGFLILDRSPRRRDAWTQPGLQAPDQLTKP